MNERVLKKIREAKANRATELNLSGKRLTSLPPQLFELNLLTKLNLQRNQLTKLPPEICQLTALTELNLGSNKLTELPTELFQLINLTTLYLDGNQLTKTPIGIPNLSKLTKLYLGAARLTSLPLDIFQLSQLTHLYLSYNKLTVLPPEICKLTNLKELHLSGNQLTKLPIELFQLTQLTWLSLSDNRLTELPPEICKLTHLTNLYFNRNQLTQLPHGICKLTDLKELHVDGTPLIYPPLEIAKKGIEAIRQYFVELDKSQHPLNEVKILLIGEGASGKTSLAKALHGKPFNEKEDATHGINIRGWDVRAGNQQIKINIWDFGGQEIQHATHQFFLSKRSLYILVLDGRKDERMEYWLRHVEAFGGNSPVLVVLNKIDNNPSFDVNRPFLREKYPNICDFFPISCKTGKGLDQFKAALREKLHKVEMIGTIWPGSWFAVKRRLEAMDRPYISAGEYRRYCTDAGITEEESCETLVDFLHDLGVAVHFRDFILDAMHVLDPVWVTEAVYKIITAEKMAESRGVLRLKCLKEIFKELPVSRLDRLRTILRLPCAKQHCCPPNTHPFIMRLMQKFELCYPVDEEAVLIPQLLPVPEPPLDFKQNGSLRFALHYPDFLPPSVFPRFMVKVHKDIHENTCWRTGMLLKDKRSGAQALVKADIEARRINIWVQGQHSRDYLHYLRYLFADINSTFEKLTVSERVPMKDDPVRTADYETLLKYAERGFERYIPEGSDEDYSVHELLGLVQPKDEKELDRLTEKLGVKQIEKESLWGIVADTVEIKILPPFINFNVSKLFKGIRSYMTQKQQQSRN